MKKAKVFLIYVIIAIFAIGFSGAYASTGIVKDDPERGITLPDEKLIDLKVKLAYNNEDVFWRFEWDAAKDGGSVLSQYLVYTEGEWVLEKQHEDRLSMLIDDGSVEGFAEYGAFITANSVMAGMLNAPSAEEAKEFGGKDYVRKFLPESRYDKDDWKSIKSKEDLQALTDSGYFLDLWHWKGYRSNSIGYSDDNTIQYDRTADPGASYNTSNFDEELGQPLYMFNPDVAGHYALNAEKVKNKEYDNTDVVYIHKDTMIEFDPNHEWQEGDVIPAFFAEPRVEGDSNSDIMANGVLEDGKWHLDMKRAMVTGNNDDKQFYEQGQYSVAIAVHHSSDHGDHLTSFPFTFGFARDAEIVANKFTGSTPPWNEMDWKTIKLFYPGQITWDHATDKDSHAGAKSVNNKIPLKEFHTEEEFSYYGIESEFRSEIKNQWLLTMGGISLFIILFSAGVIRAAAAFGRREE